MTNEEKSNFESDLVKYLGEHPEIDNETYDILVNEYMFKCKECQDFPYPPIKSDT